MWDTVLSRPADLPAGLAGPLSLVLAGKALDW